MWYMPQKSKYEILKDTVRKCKGTIRESLRQSTLLQPSNNNNTFKSANPHIMDKYTLSIKSY